MMNFHSEFRRLKENFDRQKIDKERREVATKEQLQEEINCFERSEKRFQERLRSLTQNDKKFREYLDSLFEMSFFVPCNDQRWGINTSNHLFVQITGKKVLSLYQDKWYGRLVTVDKALMVKNYCGGLFRKIGDTEELLTFLQWISEMSQEETKIWFLNRFGVV